MSACQKCKGTGLADSGGVQPWGEPILIDCDCKVEGRAMEESRKQFEEEINKKFGDLIDQRICKNSDGDYMAWDMQVAWWAWEASRAAIEIKLDEKVMAEDEFDKGHNCAIYYCSEAIRAVGLKVKA